METESGIKTAIICLTLSIQQTGMSRKRWNKMCIRDRARGRAFPVGEFNIQLNANQSWDTAGISLSGLQKKNFLNADFVNAVEIGRAHV